jgi:hypothetical protein
MYYNGLFLYETRLFPQTEVDLTGRPSNRTEFRQQHKFHFKASELYRTQIFSSSIDLKIYINYFSKYAFYVNCSAVVAVVQATSRAPYRYIRAPRLSTCRQQTMPRTHSFVSASKARVRRYCGWHDKSVAAGIQAKRSSFVRTRCAYPISSSYKSTGPNASQVSHSQKFDAGVSWTYNPRLCRSV